MTTSNALNPPGVDILDPIIRHYPPPLGAREGVTAAILRGALRVGLKPFLGPPWPAAIQRAALLIGSSLMPQDGRAQVAADRIASVTVERVRAKAVVKPRHAILYLHGGGFFAGSPRTHRSITTRLAALTGAEVVVPHYSRIPERAFPTQINEGVMVYRQLLAEGYTPDRIAIAGDSVGGNLSFMVPMALRLENLPQPGALVLMSPALSVRPLPGGSSLERAPRDVMIRLAWGEMIEAAYNAPHDHPLANPRGQNLSQLPPTLVQVGDDEVLFDDSMWLAQEGAKAGRHVELEVYLKRWHVFQVHAGLLPSADQALARQAEFLQRHWAG